MKKAVPIVAVSVLLLAGVALAGLHIAAAGDKPKPLVACANKPNEGGITVHRGCEPDEKENLQQIEDYLARLPADIASGDFSVEGVSNEELQKRLPANARLIGDPNTWARTGTIGSMGVIVTSNKFGVVPTSQTYAAVFNKTADGWQLSSMFEQE